MRSLAALLALMAAPAALAGPWDPVPSSMDELDGVRVTPAEDAYRDLVADLGTIVANAPIHPAETTGPFGFDFATTTTIAFIDAYGDDGEPTPWQLASSDGAPPTFVAVPTVSARKGLPMSLEVGATAGWMAGSRQGLAGGFARAGLVEGYKPYPDLTVQVGYSGYVGNPELGVGVLDLDVSIGQVFRMYRHPKVTFSHFAPFATMQFLRVTSKHRLDEATAAAVGATTFGGDGEAPIWLPRVAGGFQITSGKAVLRIVGAWAPATLPTLTAGFGVEI